MSTFLFTFNALAPLLLLALLGYFIRRVHLVSDHFMIALNRYIFYVALPALIVMTLLDVDNLRSIELNVILYVVLMTVIPSILYYFVLKRLPIEDGYRPVLVQGLFRGNFILIGVPLATRLGGYEALQIVVLLNVFMVPLSNVMSIVFFQISEQERTFSKEKFNALVKSIGFNPLMLAFFIGLGSYFLKTQGVWFSGDVNVFTDTLGLVAVTASPMAMIAIGGTFKYQQTKALKMPIIMGSLMRLVVYPLVAFTGVWLLSHRIDFSASYAALIAVFASPIGVSSVAVTKGLNGDEELASQLVLWTTGFAVFTLFVLVSLFRFLGFL